MGRFVPRARSALHFKKVSFVGKTVNFQNLTDFIKDFLTLSLT